MVIVSTMDFKDEKLEITAYVLRDKIEHLKHIVDRIKGEIIVFPEKDDDVPLYA